MALTIISIFIYYLSLHSSSNIIEAIRYNKNVKVH